MITEQEPATTPQPQPIDYDRMGESVAKSLRGMMPAPQVVQQPQAPISQFQEAIKAIRANPETDASSVDTLLALFEANRADLSRAQQETIGNAIVAERLRHARQVLNAEIARAVEGDEGLGRFAEAVEALVVKEFDYHPDLQVERDKVMRGELDVKAVRALVNKHLNALAGTKPKQGGLSGMASTVISPQAAAAAQAQGSNVQFKDLNENQRELYYAIIAEHDRVGEKKHGMKPEDVKATALRRASARFR
jgi:hypothetical protein